MRTYRIGSRGKPNDAGSRKIKLVPDVKFLLILVLLAALFLLGGRVDRSFASFNQTFYMQNIAAVQVCSGTNTANVTSDAGIPPNGVMQSSGSFDNASDPYHFDWTNGATDPATNISQDMFTPQFRETTYISSYDVRVDIQHCTTNTDFFVKFYDMDSSCSSTLMGQSPIGRKADFGNNRCTYEITYTPGSPYSISSGHRIRTELWVQKNGQTQTAVYYGTGGFPYDTYLNISGYTLQTTTVETGTDPASTVVGPGGAATDLDAFTVQTSGGEDVITAATLILPPDAADYIGSVEITNNDGSVTYASRSCLFGGCGTNYYSYFSFIKQLIATPTKSQYKLRMTPLSHALMPPVPGGAYNIQARVSDVSAMNATVISDSGNTVTIDNLSPENPQWGSVTSSPTQVVLNWTNPSDADFNGVIILRKLSSITDAPSEGETYTAGNTVGSSSVVYAGTGSTFTDSTIQSGQLYYYKIFSKDTRGNYSTGALTTSDHLAPGNPGWGVVTTGDTQITLNWANPADADFSQVIVLRNTSAVTDAPVEGTTYAQGNTIGSSTVRYCGSLQSFIDTGLTNNTDYYYKIFAKDTNGNYSTGSAAGPYMPVTAVTVGDGINPSNSNIAPGGPATVLDSFTLQTAVSTATVTGLTVALSPGTSTALSLVEITSDNGVMVYGSGSPSSDTVPISLSTNITATTSSTQYRVRVTPKSHINMPPPPAAQYFVTGTATAIATAQVTATTYLDSASATITVDNLSPENPTWGTVTLGDRSISLSWTNPTDSDFSQAIILKQTSPVTATPAEGVICGVGNTIGSSTVVYVGNLTSTSDPWVSNGTSYYYKIFARDTSGNYSTGIAAGPFIPLPVLIVGDGSNPSNSSVAPGGSPVMLDAFTLGVSSGNYYVQTITVNLSSETASGLGLVEITSDDGSTVYGSVTNPDSDTVTVSVGINVYSSPVQYKVRVTPKSHSVMPLPPGSTYSLTGTVIALTTNSASNVTYNDFSSGTVAIDNLSPQAPLWAEFIPGERKITLTWTNPSDPDFSQILIVRSTLPVTDTPAEGAGYVQGGSLGASTVIYLGNLQAFADTGVASVTDYYYKAFAMDNSGNYSLGAASGPHQTLVVNLTTAGTAFTRPGFSVINVYSPFTNDDNRNNSCRIEYKISSDSVWTYWTEASCGGVETIAGLSSQSTYDVRVTYQDSDGVIGTAEQTITSIKPQSDKLIHNSRTVNSRHWSQPGYGWGVAGGQYGEFTCDTCHMKNSPNISRIRDFIVLPGYPDPVGGPIRFISRSNSFMPAPRPVDTYGDDSETRFMPLTSRICEVCHTLTTGHQYTPNPNDPNHLLIGPIHRYNQTEVANHFNANGTDNCTKCCHTHETGFAAPSSYGPQCVESYPLPVPDPPAAPTVIPHGSYNDGCNSNPVTVMWNAIAATDGGTVDYNIVYSLADGSNGDSGWISGTSLQFMNPVGYSYDSFLEQMLPMRTVNWKVRARDHDHPDAVSEWSETDMFYDYDCYNYW